MTPQKSMPKILSSNFDIDDRDVVNHLPTNTKSTRSLKVVPHCEGEGGCSGRGLYCFGSQSSVPRANAEGLVRWNSAASRPMDPSKLLSNGTRELERTILIAFIDCLRWTSH